MPSGRFQRTPILVLVTGLVASLVAALLVAGVERERRDVRFSALADAVIGQIGNRLDSQRQLLRGVAALFQASNTVGRVEFAAYVDRLRLEQNNPGVLGVGWAARVRTPAELDAVSARLRQEQGPGVAPWPAPVALPGSSILFLQPDTPANRRALGFNMYGEAIRRDAMQRSLRSGRAALSGKVRLVQTGRGPDDAGFLMYVPAGVGTGARPGSAADGAGGWAYSPFRAHDLLGTALSRPELSRADVEVFDGPPRAENLLFRRGTVSSSDIRLQRTLVFGERTWTIRVGSNAAFYDDLPLPLAWPILLGGVLTTLLLAALALQQARAGLRTEAEVERATADLRQANAELVLAGQARERAEEQLRQAQKIESIGQLTGGIAHDFNNMLAVVLGNLDLAERRLDDPERLKRALHNAGEGARRAAELTQRLLAFGRQQPLQPRVLDPNALVAGMSELLRRALGETVQLETRLAPDVWPTEIDPGQLENALLNLAINGRDAMPDGGRLTIETHNRELGAEYSSRHDDLEPGHYVLIAVTDTGTGMPPDVQARALDPFFTTKGVGKGTGLGLSQVYGFVKQSGGHLNIESEPGKGTIISIFLPRAHGAVQTVNAAPSAVTAPRGSPDEVILVVEDEEGVRLTSVDALRELGYTVIHAADGHEALSQLDAHGNVRLLFTDVVMPGMNGQELCRRASEGRPDLRVLFTTGYTRDAVVHDGRLDAGVTLIMKPFSTLQLAQAVRAALDKA